MIRLGLRLALLGGRWTLVPAALTAVAVAFGTSILLFALSFQPALDVRYDRGAWRDTPGPRTPADQESGMTLLSLTIDHVEGRPLARVDVAAIGDGGPVPPGLTRLPAPGETFVSPALIELLAQRPADQLGDRFGTVVGTIGEAGLRAPNELVVVHGMPVAALQAAGSRGVTTFASEGEAPTLGWAITLIVVIAVMGAIAPVAVFVGSAARLAAARRERRLVALRLCGATPRQVAILAAVDALLITVPGAVLGIGVFFVLRPAIALFPLGDMTWFPDAVSPPLVAAVLIVAAVPGVGVIASVIALRRMSISPLGVARRVGAGPPTRWRVAPVLVATSAFAALVGLGMTSAVQDDALIGNLVLIGVALSFFGVIAGIVVLGPLLTSYVGRLLARGGGPVRLLAGRHLLDDPRASFSGVAGVVMAVFVASAFFGVVAFTNQLSGTARVALPPTTVFVETPPAGGAEVAAAVAAALDVPGAGPAAVVREAVVVDPADPTTTLAVAWIVRCEQLVATSNLREATCGDADIHVISAQVPDLVNASLVGHPPDADVVALARAMTVEMPLPPTLTMDRLLPVEGEEGNGLPDMIIEPSAVADDGRVMRPLFALVATDGARETVERVRTGLEAALPTSGAATGAEVAAATTRIVDEVGRIVTLGVFLTMAVAGASLAVAVTGGLLDRRRAFALLRLSGVTLRHLRSVLLLEAAGPLVAVAVVGGILGVLASQLLLRTLSAGVAVSLPDPSLAILLVAGVAGALAIVSGTLPLVASLTDLEETRFE